MLQKHLADVRYNPARQNLRDEYYTQRAVVAAELVHYRHHFQGASVYLNCDDPRRSEFFRFLADHFDDWGLRRLVATYWNGEPSEGRQLSFGEAPLAPRSAWKMEISREPDGHKKQTATRLQGNGDFRSPECTALLEQADMVVTNPPFSLFREHIAQIVSHGKRFLVIGPVTGGSYKNVWALIRDGQMWCGVNNVKPHFFIPADDTQSEESKSTIAVSIIWLTNLDHGQRPPKLNLTASYDPAIHPVIDHPRLNGTPIINVDRIADIPRDYYGPMGVPVTIAQHHHPDQFKLGGLIDPVVNGVEIFKRAIIRRIDSLPDPGWQPEPPASEHHGRLF